MNRIHLMQSPNAERGFTLAEVAVAFVIISLLIAGAVMPLASQIEARNLAETRRIMDQIREATIGFVQMNGRLPCPADGTTASGSVNGSGVSAGAEQYNTGTSLCTAVFGVVPWATLGVSETDAWGRRISYYVDQVFADGFSAASYGPSCTPSPALTSPMSFGLCSTGTLTVNTRNDTTHTATSIGSSLPAVFISHGKNGYGAYTSQGTTLSGVGTGTDEETNAAHNSTTTTFYSRTQAPYSTSCSDPASGSLPFCEFDDVVSMISPSMLVARMVSAGRLP